MKVIKVKNYDEVSAEAFKVMKEVVTSKKVQFLVLRQVLVQLDYMKI